MSENISNTAQNFRSILYKPNILNLIPPQTIVYYFFFVYHVCVCMSAENKGLHAFHMIAELLDAFLDMLIIFCYSYHKLCVACIRLGVDDKSMYK